MLHVNWNVTIAYSFLHTLLSSPYTNNTTRSYKSSYYSSTASNCECSQFIRNTNVLCKYKCCSCCCIELWCSSSLSDCAGQTLYMLPNLIDWQDCDPHFITMESRDAKGKTFLKVSENVTPPPPKKCLKNHKIFKELGKKCPLLYSSNGEPFANLAEFTTIPCLIYMEHTCVW